MTIDQDKKKKEISNLMKNVQNVAIGIDQDPEESLDEIKADESKLEKEIASDKESISTLKQRLEN